MHAQEVSGARGVVPSERMLGYDNGYINANIDDTRANFSRHDCHSMVSRLLGIPLRALKFLSNSLQRHSTHPKMRGWWLAPQA